MPRSTWLGRAPATSRNPQWDNIRFASGTLIVLVHLMAPLLEFSAMRWLYLATWAFRVPVFAMIAGYFSTAGPLTARDTRKLTETVLVPYLLLGLLHTVQVRYYTGTWVLNIDDPAWAMWFLLSLLMWRMMLPYLARLRFPLLLSVIAALGVGYLVRTGDIYAASQTFAFLPFFLLGWKLRQGWGAELLRARWSWYLAVGIIGATFATSWVFLRDVQLIWFGMLRPYVQETLPVDLEWAWAVRASILLVGMGVGLSFVRIAPKQRIPMLTYLGAGGFYIYLLHPLFLRFWVYSGPGVGWVDTKVEQILVVVLAVLIAAFLASPPVRALTRPVIQPRVPWLFTAAADPPRPRATDSGTNAAPAILETPIRAPH